MPLVGGLYTGLQYTGGAVNSIEQVQSLDSKLEQMVTDRKEDEVVSVFMIPSTFFGNGVASIVRNFSLQRPTTIEGYTPRNKKLLTFPFSFLSVDTINDSHDYYFEQFQDTTTANFILASSMSPTPEIVVYPQNYNGKPGQNASESVCCTGFPQCAFTIDSYRAWLSQKATGQVLTTIGSGVSAVAGAVGASSAIGAATAAGTAVAAGTVAAPLAAGVLGAVGLTTSIYNMVKDATQGSKTRGNQGSSTDVGTHNKGIYFRYMSVTAEYAKMIDSYFDRYGYTCGKIKIPNRNVRPHWTYCKTQNVSLKGEVPADDLAKIRSIYDRGITWWVNGLEVGNYGLDNSI